MIMSRNPITNKKSNIEFGKIIQGNIFIGFLNSKEKSDFDKKKKTDLIQPFSKSMKMFDLFDFVKNSDKIKARFNSSKIEISLGANSLNIQTKKNIEDKFWLFITLKKKSLMLYAKNLE